jgi:rhamnosyltransferase
MKTFNNKTGIVTVFYNPEDSALDTFISLANYGYLVIIFNNGINGNKLKKIQKCPNIMVVGNGENVGLASGLNIALKTLWEEQAIDGVVLFDQDSCPEVFLPEQLSNAYLLLSKNIKIACIGPRVIDRKNTTNDKTQSANRFKTQIAIATSGTYLNKKTFQKIGYFMDELFIDCIDYEWCFRAKNHGYEIVVDTNHIMLHDMGELGVNLFGSFKPAYKSPTRHYYIIRNTIYLLKKSYVPYLWKIEQIFKTFRRIIFYIIISSNRFLSLKNIYHGVVDGFQDRLGKIKI